MTLRRASSAVSPASGTQPSSSTSTASQVLPSSKVASSATKAAEGGAALAEPTPTGWNARNTSPHRVDAPSQAGSNRAAAERAAAEQRVLGHRGHDDEGDQQQDGRSGDESLQEAAVGQQRVVVGRIVDRGQAGRSLRFA